MPVRKITATTPYGVLTRKTHRTYTHVVIGIGTRPEEITARFVSGKAYNEKLAAKYRKVIESGAPEPGYYSCTLDDYARWANECEEKARTSDERLAAALVKNAEAIAESKIATTIWAGRPDLAMKAAGKLRADGYFKVETYAVDQEEK